MENQTIVIGAKVTKQAIVGNGWFPKPDNNQPGTIKISRDLPNNISLTAGAVFNINLNTRKREGKQDPDFNISVTLPTSVADQMIADMKENSAKRTESTDSEEIL